MANKKQLNILDKEQMSLNNRALKTALRSLHQRGVSIEQLSADMSLIICLSCMSSVYYKLYSGQIDKSEAINKISDCWDKYQHSGIEECF